MMAKDRYENSRNGTAPGRKATENFLPFSPCWRSRRKILRLNLEQAHNQKLLNMHKPRQSETSNRTSLKQLTQIRWNESYGLKSRLTVRTSKNRSNGTVCL